MTGKSINKIEAITIAHAAAAIAGMVDAVPEFPEEIKKYHFINAWNLQQVSDDF